MFRVGEAAYIEANGLRQPAQFCHKPTQSMKKKSYLYKSRKVGEDYHININQNKIEVGILLSEVQYYQGQRRLFYEDSIASSLEGRSTLCTWGY